MPSNTSSTAAFAWHGHSFTRLSLLLMVASGAPAFAAPDAGAVLQQIEQNLKTQPSGHDEPKAIIRPSVGQAQPGAVKVHVQRFDFQGNTLLSREQLEEVVAPWLQQDLDFQQLRQIALLVTNAYHEAGWLARVSLPQQDIRDGVVRLQIVEATFGKARIQGHQSRIDPQWIEAFVDNAQSEGQPVSSQRIDRALLLLNDIPGMTVAGNLVEGAQVGQTDLLLGANDRNTFSGSVTTDNTGARSTGIERVLVSLNVNGPMQLGDQLALTALKTRGSEYQRVGYTVPVGYDGWRAGVHATHLAYGLIGELATSNTNGTAYSSGLDLSYPWIRSQATNVNLSVTADQKRFVNNSPINPSNYRIGVYNLALSGSQEDAWQGGGVTGFSLSGSMGTVNLNGSPNQDKDAGAAATAGRFSKLNLGLNRLQTLDRDLSAYLALNVQQANKNLDSSERLYLGGASGVRAYPASEGAGSLGQTLTVELRQRLDSQYMVTGFYDRGHVQAFKSDAYADGAVNLDDGSVKLNSSPSPNNYSLSGYGASLAWQAPTGIEFRATLARRVGTTPLNNPTIPGMDLDGTRKLNRVWVSATANF